MQTHAFLTKNCGIRTVPSFTRYHLWITRIATRTLKAHGTDSEEKLGSTCHENASIRALVVRMRLDGLTGPFRQFLVRSRLEKPALTGSVPVATGLPL